MTEQASYKDLLQERQALDERIKEARRREISVAVNQVRQLIADFDLSPQDVFPSGRIPRAASVNGVSGTKVAPKYRDPATGQTWTGRGKPPRWIQNQDRKQFEI